MKRKKARKLSGGARGVFYFQMFLIEAWLWPTFLLPVQGGVSASRYDLFL